MEPELIRGLERAVLEDPSNRAVRVHLVGLLLDAGRAAAALDHCQSLLAADPADPEAARLADRARNLVVGATEPPPDSPKQRAELDTPEAEPELIGLGQDVTPDDLYEIYRPDITLDDVAGMAAVKERIRLGFLEPIRHPELAKAYGHSLRRSLLLWGPPGCGKTFLAKALAGELGVCFIAVGIADVLDMWIGSSERNLKSLFHQARQLAPSLLFIDEIDALGRRRTHMRHDSGGRNVVNQLLTELDGVDTDNSGLFVLAATNHPWDIDPALVRPGRFDHMVLVLPPDGQARRAILAYHLRDRPVGEVDLQRLVDRTDGFSGADLAHLCQRATELVMHQAVRTGAVVKIEQADLERAGAELRPSTTEWLRVAKNVAEFSDDDRYEDLARYIHQRRL